MDIVRYYLFVEGVKMKFKQILRFDVVEITEDVFNEQFFTKLEPVLIGNLDNKMPIYNKWNFDFFKNNCLFADN